MLAGLEQFFLIADVWTTTAPQHAGSGALPAVKTLPDETGESGVSSVERDA